MKSRTVFICVLQAIFAQPMDMEGSREMQTQTSNNAVPRIGRRTDETTSVEKRTHPSLRQIPSFTSGFIPNFSMYKSRNSKKSGQDLEKRAPWTSSWANLLYKPGNLRKEGSKRSAIPDAWGSPWENFLRSQQGFRINSGDSDYLSNAVMYKRAQNHIQELNSVPMLGKRQTEPSFSFIPENWMSFLYRGQPTTTPSTVHQDHKEEKVSQNVEHVDGGRDAEDSDWDMLFNQDGPLMADVSLYPPVVGPHYRTILTRVQRSRS